ncbi:MAG: 30S ribosomal protein S19e [Promethearchaeota archaeon]
MSKPRVVNIYHVDPTMFINKMAEKLKTFSEINPPLELKFWKTSCAKEFPPENADDFWYIRAASLLRKLAMKKSIGVRRLRKIYGTAQRRGHRPRRSRMAAGKIIRRCLQNLEKAGLVINQERVGRRLSPEGQSLVDSVSHEIVRELEGQGA